RAGKRAGCDEPTGIGDARIGGYGRQRRGQQENHYVTENVIGCDAPISSPSAPSATTRQRYGRPAASICVAPGGGVIGDPSAKNDERIALPGSMISTRNRAARRPIVHSNVNGRAEAPCGAMPWRPPRIVAFAPAGFAARCGGRATEMANTMAAAAARAPHAVYGSRRCRDSAPYPAATKSSARKRAGAETGGSSRISCAY